MPTPSVIAVIPARYGSTRFPGKPLVPIGGIPMIQRVYQQAKQSTWIDEVVVATDDQRIVERVVQFGGKAVMTSNQHTTGTDRIVEVMQNYDCEWVLNIQGDEPLISPLDLDALVQAVYHQKQIHVATLIVPLEEKNRQNVNIVKVVINHKNEAMYFSRSPIPCIQGETPAIWKHVGIYLFRRSFLLQFAGWSSSSLEKAENLEQLRILENGEKILCIQAQHDGVGVDTPEDVIKVEKILQNK